MTWYTSILLRVIFIHISGSLSEIRVARSVQGAVKMLRYIMDYYEDLIRVRAKHHMPRTF